MKKLILISIAALALNAAAYAEGAKAPADKKAEAPQAAPAKKSKCDDCPMHKKMAEGKKCGGMTCPEKIAGAVTASKNTESGVEISITGKAPETVAKIQELAVVHYSPKAEKCPGCPTAVPGAETKVENTADGIKVVIAGKTPEVIKQIQTASAREHKGHEAHGKPAAKKEAKAAKKYTCAMKCVTADKPGKCPRCGMPMEEVR